METEPTTWFATWITFRSASFTFIWAEFLGFLYLHHRDISQVRMTEDVPGLLSKLPYSLYYTYPIFITSKTLREIQFKVSWLRKLYSAVVSSATIFFDIPALVWKQDFLLNFFPPVLSTGIRRDMSFVLLIIVSKNLIVDTVWEAIYEKSMSGYKKERRSSVQIVRDRLRYAAIIGFFWVLFTLITSSVLRGIQQLYLSVGADNQPLPFAMFVAVVYTVYTSVIVFLVVYIMIKELDAVADQPRHYESIYPHVQKLCEEKGFPVDKVIILRQPVMNAFCLSFFNGKVARIAIFTGLIDNLKPSEVGGVFAHELGHWAGHHGDKGLGLETLLRTGINGYTYFLLKSASGLLKAFGLHGIEGLEQTLFPALFVTTHFVLRTVQVCSSSLQNMLIHYHEEDADEFAVRSFRNNKDAMALSMAFAKMASNHFMFPTDDYLFTWICRTHPSMLSRMEHVHDAVNNRP